MTAQAFRVFAYFLGASYLLGTASAIGLFSLFVRKVYKDNNRSNPDRVFKALAVVIFIAAMFLVAKGLLILDIPSIMP